jgi:nucleotide-binding universal stress UspA family protein
VQRTALLAKQMNADVLFLHVVSNWQPERILRLKANRARARLIVHVDKVMSDAPDSARVEIHIGKPLEVIAEIAEEWNADLIVLAAPVTRRYERLLGTTAERIIRSVACPVLIVNRESAKSYGQVVVATDLSATSARVAHAIGRMGVLQNTYAWFVHASEPLSESAISGGQTNPDEVAMRANRWQQRVTTELKTQLAHAGLDLSCARITAEMSPPLEAIEQIIAKADPELLVIGTSRWFGLKRMLLRSVAHQLLKSVSCDVLAISPVSVEREERKRRDDDLQVRYRRSTEASVPLLNI